jgi:cell division protein FtsZ
MNGAGSALMGIGHARGDDRAVAAAEMAISSPLLEASIEGAHGVLLSICGGSDLGLFEINEAAQLVASVVHEEANIIFGAVIDDALGDEVRVTVIAAGFDGGSPAPAREPRRRDVPVEQAAPVVTSPASPEIRPIVPDRITLPETPSSFGEQRRPPAAQGAQDAAARARRTIVFEDGDDLDVPDFLK